MNKMLSNLKIPFFIFAIFVSSNVQSQCETLTFSYALDGATSNQYCTDNSGWHHFYDSNDEVILSVQGNFAGAPAGYPIASVAVNPTLFDKTSLETPIFEDASICADGFGVSQSLEMNRSWNIDFGGGALIPIYNVRFYYKPEEQSAIETLTSSYMANYPDCNYTYTYPIPNGLYFFQNTQENYVAPQYDGLHLNGSYGMINGINYIELFGLTNLSGGSAAVKLDFSPLDHGKFALVSGTNFLGSISNEDKWDYYGLFNSNQDVYFGVKASHSGSITSPDDDLSYNPQIIVSENSTFYQENESLINTPSDCSNGLSPGEQRFEMKRSWSVDIPASLNLESPMSVRFFYDPAEKEAIETAAANFINAHPDCGYTYKYNTPMGFKWFINTGANQNTPQYDGDHPTSTIGFIDGIRVVEINGITNFPVRGSGGIILVPDNNTLSAPENDFIQKLKIYPNPTYGNLSIELDQQYSKINIEVYNILGKLVLQKEELNSNNMQLTINNSAGLYFMKIQTSDGQKTTIKILKK
jgi:hypothetical protein